MKSGWQSGATGTSDPLLRWDVSSATQWNTTWEAGVWHNIAYGIDFSAGSVELYHSTGADDLTLAHEAVSVTASSNGADWHLGVLELPRDGYTDETEDMYFSGVYFESGDLTTSVTGGAVGGSSASSSVVASSVPVSSSIAHFIASSVAVTSSIVSSSISSAAAVVSSIPSSIDVGTVTRVSTFSTATASSLPSATASIAQIATSSTAEAAATPSGSADDEDDEGCE